MKTFLEILALSGVLAIVMLALILGMFLIAFMWHNVTVVFGILLMAWMIWTIYYLILRNADNNDNQQ